MTDARWGPARILNGVAGARLVGGRGAAAVAVVVLLLAAVAVGGPHRGATAAESLAGRLVVATPQMRDPRFAETVIYMVNHDAKGAMGLVVNRPIGEVPLADMLERLGLDSDGASGAIRVHYGGPVESGQGFVLHTPEYAVEGTVVVNELAALTGRVEIMRAIASGSGPRRSLMVFGYAGWRAGQLEGEFKTGSWISVPADEALVFGDDYEDKWRRALARRTIDL